MALTRVDYYTYLLNVYGLNKGTITKSWKNPSLVNSIPSGSKAVEWPYPIDFSQDVVNGLLADEKGVPMIDYTNLGTHYNPWFIGHIALGLHSRWIKNKQRVDLLNFQGLADWFAEHAVKTPNGVVWLYHFNWFGQKKPWRSGLSQAHAISVLLRAATIFEDNKYDLLAEQAMQEMIAPVENGGTAIVREDNSVSFEEYISNNPVTVLNGHVFSSIACWEANCYFNNEAFDKVTAAAMQFVLNNLCRYDMGFWSKYSLQKKRGLYDIASSHYHDVHIAQLKALYNITGNQTFNKYAILFKEYQSNKVFRNKALLYKSLYKLL